jgi:hypothetical protein
LELLQKSIGADGYQLLVAGFLTRGSVWLSKWE